MSDTHELDELLQRATAPHMHFDPATAIATGRKVRRRRRIATAGGSLAAVTAVGIAVTAAMPGSGPLMPAGLSQGSAGSPTPAASATTSANLCFPSDSERGTAWASGTAAGSSVRGGDVVVEATLRKDCGDDVVGVGDFNGDAQVTVMFRSAPTTAEWVVADAAVLFLPKGQRPCGYSFGTDLPKPTVLPQSNGWDLVVQPVPQALQRKAAETGTVDICRGSTPVKRGLKQIVGGVAASLEAHEPFNNPTTEPTSTGCDLDNLVGSTVPGAVQWVDEKLTVPGAGRVTVDVQTHPGCTGDGHTLSWFPAQGARLEVDVPAKPKTAFWDSVPVGDTLTGVFLVPPQQSLCDIDFSRSGLSGTPKLAAPQRVPQADGWTVVAQPLPKVDNPLTLSASFCTGSKVTTSGVVPSS
jgi:hypothetical protein